MANMFAEEANEDEQKKKKKAKRHRELVLEEEDYELLEENTGIRRERPAQHRRLKKARDIGEKEGKFVGVEDLQAELFGPEGAEDLEDDLDGAGAGQGQKTTEGSQKPQGNDVDEDDIFDEDEDDWIVDEYEEAAAAEGGEEAAKAARRRRKKMQQAALKNLPGVDLHALEEAHAIFGDVDEYMESYERLRQQRERNSMPDEEEDEYGDLQPSDLDDEEAAAELRSQRDLKNRKNVSKSFEKMDPEAAARYYLLPADDAIRETDLPEREQLQAAIVSADIVTGEECIKWIWRQLIYDSETKARTIIEDGVREVEGPPPEVCCEVFCLLSMYAYLIYFVQIIEYSGWEPHCGQKSLFEAGLLILHPIEAFLKVVMEMTLSHGWKMRQLKTPYEDLFGLS